MSNRQNILDFLRSKSRPEVEEYAIANDIMIDGVSTDQLDNDIADVLESKYSRYSNTMMPKSSDCGCSGAMSPRTRKFTQGNNLGYNLYNSNARSYNMNNNMSNNANARSYNMNNNMSNNANARSKSAAQNGMDRWANQYGSGYIPASQDQRGKSPKARAYQQRERDAGMGSGLSAAQAAHALKQQSQNANAYTKTKGALSPRTRYGSTQNIDQMARQVVQDISGGDMLQNVSQYTQAVRALAGAKMQNGSGVSAVEATHALKPYYNAVSRRGSNNMNNNMSNNANARSKNPMIHKWGNQYGSGTISASQDQRGKSPASRAWQEEERQMGQQMRSQNANAYNANARSYNANAYSKSPRAQGATNGNWLNAVKACTDNTDLNAIECAVALGDVYQAKRKTNRNSPYRDQIYAQAEQKLSASGANLSQILADAGVDTTQAQSPRAMSPRMTQAMSQNNNANGRNGKKAY